MNHRSLDKLLESLGGQSRIVYSLDRIQSALASFGNPERNVYSLVISGTNGKGTTSLMLSAALTAQGHRVGTYLSPHLQSPAERFLKQLKPIDEKLLEELANELYPTATRFELSYFEFLTLIYFVWASRTGMEFSILEVGLGGRLDATNVTNAIGCAITNIALDHQSYLGDTTAKILEEKMGILRPESLLFSGEKDPALLNRLEVRCNELDAIYYFSRELRVTPQRTTWEGQTFEINGHPFFLSNPSRGARENASLAYLMLRVLFPKISVDVLQTAFAGVRNPGRLEIVSHRPRVILSGDHNPAGIECLKQTLSELGHPRVKTVCAFSPDKPYVEMYRELAALSEEIWLTEIDRLAHATTDQYRALGPFESDALALVDRIVNQADENDTILITGSLYLIGEVRKLWKKESDFFPDSHTAPERFLAPRGGPNPAKSHSREPVQIHAP